MSFYGTAKFLRNLESRIYSQLSRDIAESLFDSEKGGTGGSIELEGSTITFVNDGINITLTVTDADGNVTTIIIPVGIFGICSEYLQKSLKCFQVFSKNLSNVLPNLHISVPTTHQIQKSLLLAKWVAVRDGGLYSTPFN